MRRLRHLLLGLTTAVLFVLPVTTAAAKGDDHSDWRIDKYAVVATIDADDGDTHVQLDLDFNFGRDPGHGPYLFLTTQQAINGDDDHWRALDVKVDGVTSSTGANVEQQVNDDSGPFGSGGLLIRLGNENRTYTGVQSYTIKYTIHGLIARNQKDSGLDEFNWNVVGAGWSVPISNVSAQVTGPVDIVDTACFTGAEYGLTCTDDKQGTTASFSHPYLAPGEPMQIVAGFPAGTFGPSADARFTKRYNIGNMFPITPVTGGLAAVLTVLGLGTLIWKTRRGARDQVYLGLTPGLTPAAGQEGSVGRQSGKVPVAVQFTPPAGARPGELGVLTDNTADTADITATMIDLAVRGYLRIEQTGRRDWTFHRLAENEGLIEYERELFDNLFDGGDSVTTDELKEKSYASVLTSTRSELYRRVTHELHWFTRNPSVVRALAFGAGLVLIAASAGLGFLLGFVGFGLLGVAGVITGLGVLLASNRFGARTAEGSAVLAQTKGFELYLSTAEADQIKFEEGIDVFSRYLPYAIVFGVADRWTAVFRELESAGQYTPSSTGWYYGYGYGYLSSDFASSMSHLSSQVASSMQAASAASTASSGGSGFSGGGGFGGGGGGGW